MPMTTIIDRSMSESLRGPRPVPLALVPHEVIWAAIVNHHEDGVARSHARTPPGLQGASLVVPRSPGPASPAREARQ